MRSIGPSAGHKGTLTTAIRQNQFRLDQGTKTKSLS
jgi:hypothetical protein